MNKLQEKLVSKINNPILLVSISFGIMLVSIGIYDYQKVLLLWFPIVIVFFLGICGAIYVNYLGRKKTNQENLRAIFSVVDHETLNKSLSSLSKDTKEIRILSLAGFTFSFASDIYTSFSSLRNTDIKILLLDPNSEYVKTRANENPHKDEQALKDTITSGINTILNTKNNNNLKNMELRLYNSNPVFKYIRIDTRGLVSYFPMGSPIDEPVYILNHSKKGFYPAFEKYFDSIRNESKRIEKI